jgi:DHA2 family multidrug resistance protein-like MFS transporter
VIYSLGISPVVILATDLIVGSAPVERAGAAAAISETSSEFGGALGIAILGSIGTAVYRSVMADEVLAGVAPEAARAARGTLGGALAVAERLPNQLGGELLGTAREAFAQAFELTGAICAAIAVATAILAVVVLRSVRAGGEPDRKPGLEPARTVAGSLGLEESGP